TRNNLGPPFFGRVHHQLHEDPERRWAKLVFAVIYSTALREFGPELYEHVILISCCAVTAMLDCATRSTLCPMQPSSEHALWIKHINLILSDQECVKIDWVGTQQAWSAFHHLKTLTICYHPKEPAPLLPYHHITTHLSPSLQLLRLRPWGKSDSVPPHFPQVVRHGANGRILGRRQDFWWSESWAEQVYTFQNVLNIHLQVVVYVVWPLYSQTAAEKVFQLWTARVDGGRLHNISVTLFLPYEGMNIQEAIQQFDGDLLSKGKRYSYFPQNAKDVDDPLPEFLSYDWRIDKDGTWEVDVGGMTTRNWARDYGSFSYKVAGKLDYRLEWGWY
ncbi:hypothetical protein V8D89_002574, partial [Ganoderma adspersum]